MSSSSSIPGSLRQTSCSSPERGKSKQITLKYCFMGDLGETTIILNLIPCMTHATIPYIQWFLHTSHCGCEHIVPQVSPDLKAPK